MKSWVFSVQNYPDSRPSVENCPAGKSPSLPRSSRCQGRSPALAGAERQRSALTAESRGVAFTPGRAVSSARNNRCNRPSAALTSALWIKPRSPFRAPHRSPVPASRAEPPGAWPPPPSVRTPARATVVPWTTRPWPPTWPSSTTLAAPRAARSSPSPPSASAPAWSPTIRPEPPPNKARSPATCSALTTARGEPQAARSTRPSRQAYTREPPSPRDCVRRTIVQVRRPSLQPTLTCSGLEVRASRSPCGPTYL